MFRYVFATVFLYICPCYSVSLCSSAMSLALCVRTLISGSTIILRPPRLGGDFSNMRISYHGQKLSVTVRGRAINFVACNIAYNTLISVSTTVIQLYIVVLQSLKRR